MMDLEELELLMAASIFGALQAENLRRGFTNKQELMKSAILDARELRVIRLWQQMEKRT